MYMRNPILAFPMLVALCAAGCSDDNHDGDDGDDDGGGGPPFTDGVSTLSGAAEAGYVDGRRGVARLANPVNVAFHPDGVVYVADFDNGKIRAVDADDGATSTVVAITGFQRPFGMALADDGTLYVSTDRDPEGNHGPMSGTIWRVDIEGRTAVPIAVRIGRPRGLAVLPDGRIAASDYSHHVIQLVDPGTGAVTLLAGAWDAPGHADGVGASARFSTPYGVAYTGGELVVADLGNHRLRRVRLDGTVSARAGNGTAGYADGDAATARFNRPQGVTATDGGDLYVTDTENYRIRRIRGSTVATIAGNGEPGYRDHDNPLEAQFFGMEGLSVRPDGSELYVADGTRGESQPYHRVRSVKLD
jgi:sugar lactone lactonase YvrE